MVEQERTAKPAIGLDALSIYILYRIYLDYVNDQEDQITLDYICRSYFANPSRNLTRTALERFRGNGFSSPKYIQRSGNRTEGYTYAISPEGIEAVEDALGTENSLMRHIAREGEAALLANYSVDTTGDDEILAVGESASEPDDWAEVVFDENSAEYKEAIDAVEKLVVEIRISNIFSDQFPGQSGAVVDTLQGGVGHLKEGKASRMQVFLLLQKPIIWLAEKFVGTALGEVATKAGAALAKLLGF